MILSDDDLFTLTETIWSSVLGLELSRADEVDGKIGERAMTSAVQITGDWEGAVTVTCSAALAGHLAAAMFACTPEELSDDEVRDAMGEIANMTGGNVKGMLPGTNTLALPTVVEGDQTALSISRTQVLNRVVAMSQGEPVVFVGLGRED